MAKIMNGFLRTLLCISLILPFAWWSDTQENSKISTSKQIENLINKNAEEFSFVRDTDLGNDEAIALANAIKSGQLKNLKVLNLSSINVKPYWFKVLIEAITIKNLPNLKELDLYGTYGTDMSYNVSQILIKAIERGDLQSL